MTENIALNTDCVEYMRTLPDGFFDLTIADPPYGIGEATKKTHTRGKLAKPTLYTPKDWDSQAPDKEYIKEHRDYYYQETNFKPLPVR